MYKKNEHFHFMGIGGIGMSGIAKILLGQGYQISGCDNNNDQQTIKDLIKLGCTIAPHHQHDICLDPTITTLIYSTDILKPNPTNIPHEMFVAKQRNIPIILRATMLAELMRTKFSIAVAGSHGKTTTSSLLSHVLLETNQNPTIIVGGYIHSIQSNAQSGTGKYLVAEADESDRSFLELPKTFSIVTNIDREHLDTYHDLDDIKQTFLQFIHQIPFYGLNIFCLDDPGVFSIIDKIKAPYISYGTDSAAHIRIQDVQLYDDQSIFTLFDTRSNHVWGTFTVALPGLHNVSNTTAVVIMARMLNIPQEAIQKALQSFTGVDRRFSFKGISSSNKAQIFDDYGHHPTEIAVTLKVARKKAKKQLIVIFQPQRFTRTKHLWDDFVDLFANNSLIDQLIITDIYPASEQPIEHITSENLVIAIKKRNPRAHVFYHPFVHPQSEILQYLQHNAHPDDLILFQGAGKVNQLIKRLVE